MPRILVVNGDDFGLTPGINAGIVDAHLRGILTSASLFANAPATDEATRIAARTPSLGIGCHLALVDGQSVLPPGHLPTLAPDGRFPSTWGAFIRRALTRRLVLDEIERELAAQIDRLRSAGIRPTHIDAHKHLHAYPPVFEIVVRLARRFEIRRVRVPFERSPLLLLAAHMRQRPARRQAMENLALSPWAARNRRQLAREGFTPPPAFLGRAITGVFSASRLHALLHSVPEGVSELMTHPGYPDDALTHIHTRLVQQRATEVELLTSPEVLDIVRRERLVLARHDGVVSDHHSFTVARYAS